jgi:hypothetical protein
MFIAGVLFNDVRSGRSEMFIAGVLFNDVRSGRNEMFTCACIALLRSAVFFKDSQSYKHAAPPEQEQVRQYVDAVLTVSVFANRRANR